MSFQTKDELRKIFREKRARLTPKQKYAKDREIAKNFYANVSIAPSSIIAGYAATGSEVDISLLLEMYAEDGHTICMPAFDEKDAPMVFREFKTGVPLVSNKFYNFSEPPKGMKEFIPDVIITPLLAFDSAGNRLGMGMGFYDRTLEYLNGFKDFIAIGVAYSIQQTEFVRTDSSDFQLHALVTEKKTFTFDNSAPPGI